MSRTVSRIEWRRVALESAVIVGSILLAFWIDAAWAAREERQGGRELTAALRADVEATQQLVADNTRHTEQVIAQARTVLEGLAGDAPGVARDSLLLRVGSVFVLDEWTPTTHSYQQALGSGDLALVRDPELRRLLGSYHAMLEQLRSIYESQKTQYYGTLEPFMVEETVYSELAYDAWRDRLVQGPFTTDLERLVRSRELWNLLTLKLELEEAVLSRLQRADSVGRELALALDSAGRR